MGLFGKKKAATQNDKDQACSSAKGAADKSCASAKSCSSAKAPADKSCASAKSCSMAKAPAKAPAPKKR